jgi:hypothetical protein
MGPPQIEASNTRNCSITALIDIPLPWNGRRPKKKATPPLYHTDITTGTMGGYGEDPKALEGKWNRNALKGKHYQVLDTSN